MVSSTNISIIAAGALIAGAVLYSTGSIDFSDTLRPYERFVRDRFVDPESVQFRNVTARSNSHYCGEVNAKNRMGGYTGWQEFAAIDSFAAGKNFKVWLASEVGGKLSVC